MSLLNATVDTVLVRVIKTADIPFQACPNCHNILEANAIERRRCTKCMAFLLFNKESIEDIWKIRKARGDAPVYEITPEKWGETNVFYIADSTIYKIYDHLDKHLYQGSFALISKGLPMNNQETNNTSRRYYLDLSLDDEHEDYGEVNLKVSLPEEANLISSRLWDNTHKPALDLDLECELIASSTPGHYHLYIDKAMSWEDYEFLLYTLAKVGILEQNYYEVSKKRKMTLLRKPGTYKPGFTPILDPTKTSLEAVIEAQKNIIKKLETQLKEKHAEVLNDHAYTWS